MPQPELFTLFTLVLVILICLALARRQDRRRSRAFVAALNQSTFGTLKIDHEVQVEHIHANGFAAWLTPAPEPFRQLLIAFEPRSTLSITNWWRRLRHDDIDRLVFIGRLQEAPTSEFIWSNGELAGRALTVGDRPQLWQRKQFDVGVSEYVMRGANAPALENIFRSLFARFGPMLQHIHVEKAVDFEMPTARVSDQTHLYILLNSAKLAPQEIPALTAAILALGEAATH